MRHEHAMMKNDNAMMKNDMADMLANMRALATEAADRREPAHVQAPPEAARGVLSPAPTLLNLWKRSMTDDMNDIKGHECHE
jgi:hypothetical protein